MSKISLEVIQHMAKLSRLEVNEEQSKKYVEQLSQIMKYFDNISSLSTEGVEPMVTPTEIETFWREDKVEKNFTSEQMVENAPSRQGSLFKVPPVV